MKRFLQSTFWPLLLAFLFAVWWGGLTFYAVVVVPLGTELIGSIEQGFVTQKVTVWHNVLLAAMTLCVVVEACLRGRLAWWLLAGGMLTILAALLYTHWQLSGMLDVAERSVPTGFYSLHARYLWLTTVEWLLGIWLAVMWGQGPKQPSTS